MKRWVNEKFKELRFAETTKTETCFVRSSTKINNTSQTQKQFTVRETKNHPYWKTNGDDSLLW